MRILLLVLAAAFLQCEAGCGATLRIGEPGSEHVQLVLVRVAPNYLSFKPWRLGIIEPAEAERFLNREVTLRCGDYSLTHLCKEISRVTGKRIVWLSEPNESIPNWAKMGPITTLPPPDAGRQIDKGQCIVAVHNLLSYLVSEITIAWHGSLESEASPKSVWTAWMSRDAICLVLLPRRTVPFKDNTALSTPAGQENTRLPQNEAMCFVPVVLPRADMFGEPVQLDLLSAEMTRLSLDALLSIKAGPYSIRTLSETLQRLTGKDVIWYPPPVPPQASDDDSQRRVFGTELINTTEWWFSHERDTAPQGDARPVPTSGDVPVKLIIDEITGIATEVGLARRAPDREVWVAVLASEAIIYILLPGVVDK